MTHLALSDDLIEITAEINIYKHQAGQAVFEIGKRLKHVKENDLAHGQWTSWLESVDIRPRTAQAMIQAFEQFGNTQTSAVLQTGKIFEMLSLPESVNRDDFINTEHIVPSTGETKTVDEMTVKELREVKQALQKAEQEARHWQGVAKSAQNQPPKVVTQTVEVVPVKVQAELADLQFKLKNAQKGYQDASDRLKAYENRDTTEFDEEQSRLQREKLQHEADINTLQLRITYKQFIEKAAVSGYLQGAIATSTPAERQRLSEMVEIAEKIIDQTKLALKGRRLGVVNE